MNSERLRQLLAYLDESPDDPFILYALAMEYRTEKPEEADQLFTELLNQHPDYLPTYYQAASFQESKGNIDKAIQLYRAGILLAEKQKDSGALKELKAAYQLLENDL
ncbi:MAG: tetratricopeptide repeat protein [Cyclobacteriaceae bacterium]|jgi:tetratricopeptide (TPR) repeat protein|nr:tetratricopeptide repeat protein [Cyclobacteriaceae bacterium]